MNDQKQVYVARHNVRFAFPDGSAKWYSEKADTAFSRMDEHLRTIGTLVNELGTRHPSTHAGPFHQVYHVVRDDNAFTVYLDRTFGNFFFTDHPDGTRTYGLYRPDVGRLRMGDPNPAGGRENISVDVASSDETRSQKLLQEILAAAELA